MTVLGKNYVHVLVIGNGFDLNLGLPTSYTDFLDSHHFEAFRIKAPIMSKRLTAVQRNNGWVDIEDELARFGRTATNSYRISTDFKKEYDNLRLSLTDYINDLDYSAIDQDSQAAKVIRELSNKDNLMHGLCVVNFNYTESLAKLDGLGS